MPRPKNHADLFGLDAAEVMKMGMDHAALSIRGEGTRIIRRLNYLTDNPVLRARRPESLYFSGSSRQRGAVIGQPIKPPETPQPRDVGFRGRDGRNGVSRGLWGRGSECRSGTARAPPEGLPTVFAGSGTIPSAAWLADRVVTGDS